MAHPAATLQTDRGARRAGRGLPLPEWRPIAWVAAFAAMTALVIWPLSHNTYIEIFGETLFVGVVLLAAFTWAGSWRQSVVPAWVAQVAAVVVAAPLGPLVVQLLTAGGNLFAFIASRSHVKGFFLVTFTAVIIGLMVALGALLRERDARTRALSLQVALERETLERQAADTRLRLLTAQIQPHFLLNTLANVQELVETGSPRAVPVFRSLIEYLRAAVPRLQHDGATLADEQRLVRAYLELMQMRMPDRLAWSVDLPADLQAMRFPPMALLTLVENAIRHGIDPSIEGGRIDVGGRREGDAVRLWVADSGEGLADNAGGGTGLANLQERLRAAFGPDARVELSEQSPHGVRADILVTAPA